MAYYHGGVPYLKVGDLIEPGHERQTLDDCPICQARVKGEHAGIDGPSKESGVYATTDRLYAKHYASLYGRGDLYRVEPEGEYHASNEDTYPSIVAERLRVVAVLDRAVLLTMSERRRLAREWAEADRKALERRN